MHVHQSYMQAHASLLFYMNCARERLFLNPQPWSVSGLFRAAVEQGPKQAQQERAGNKWFLLWPEIAANRAATPIRSIKKRVKYPMWPVLGLRN